MKSSTAPDKVTVVETRCATGNDRQQNKIAMLRRHSKPPPISEAALIAGTGVVCQNSRCSSGVLVLEQLCQIFLDFNPSGGLVRRRQSSLVV